MMMPMLSSRMRQLNQASVGRKGNGQWLWLSWDGLACVRMCWVGLGWEGKIEVSSRLCKQLKSYVKTV